MAYTEKNLELALSLAAQGLFVFPCQGAGDRRKQPCYGIWSWPKQSTTDPKIIREWWLRWPDAVPAIDHGRSGLITFDLDRGEKISGADWLRANIGEVDAPGCDTPSGGRHLTYLNRKDKPFGNGRGNLPPKSEAPIDVRGDGGYTIAGGSWFKDGGHYVPRGDLRNAQPLPPWAIDLLTVKQHDKQPDIVVPAEPVSPERALSWGEAALDGMCAELSSTPEGDRNNTANKLAFRAGRMVAGGLLAQGEARARLIAAVVQAGLPPREAAQAVSSGLKGGITGGGGKTPPITGPTDDTPAVTIDAHLLGDDVPRETPEMGDMEKTPPTGGVLSIPGEGDWSQPQGLLGGMADWIMATSRRPNRPLAVAAATATLSTICGRHLFGPTGTALNLYIVMLAQTSVGKDRPLDAPQALLTAAGFPRLWQSAKAFSVSAIEQRMQAYPCHLAVADEIDTSLLSRLSQNKYRPPHEIGMRSTILELWSRVQGKGPFSTTRRAQGEGVKDLAVNIPSPSLTMLGAATHEAFYNVLSGTSIRDGFLNRFLICHAGTRGATQEVPAKALIVPSAIAEGLAALVPEVGGGNMDALNGVFHLDTPLDQVEHRVPWADDDVEATAKAFESAILALGDANAEEAPLLGRVFEYAVRLATLHAVSRAGFRFKAAVDKDDWAWGVAWAQQSASTMIQDAKLYMADSEAQAIARAIRRVLDGKGRVRHSTLLRALDNKYKTRELGDTLKSMIEDGRVQAEDVKTAGRTGRWYHWVG